MMILFGSTIFTLFAHGCNDDGQTDAPVPDAGGILDAGESRDAGGKTDEKETDSSSMWVRSPYDGADSKHPYGACEAAVATGEAPLISDFDDGKIRVLPNEGRSGAWQTSDDASGGTLGVDIESGALHIVSSGWTDWGSGVGAVIAPSLSDTEHCYYDASHYAGVRFRSKGKGEIQFKIASIDNYPISLGGTCNRPGSNCFDRPMAQAQLTDEWQTFEFAFCALKPQGWGGDTTPINPADIVDIYFMFLAGQEKEVWIDDLEFFTTENAIGDIECEEACPMALVPRPETIVPEESYLTLTDELTLHTFEQETTSCGPLGRRYLSYVPKDLGADSDVPVVMGLHGTRGNAEGFRDSVSHGRLEALAARDGFIVVYGNAAPGFYSSDNPQWRNTGSWRQTHYDDGEVDDVAYLQMVLDDLKKRTVISGDNDVYLVGFSNGGGMVLKAAKEKPEMFKGIAPFMSYDGWTPAPVPDLRNTGLERVMFVYTFDDPRISEGYDDILSNLPIEWAEALGIPEDVIQNPAVTSLPNLVNEGESYTGDHPLALRTRNSSVTQLDFASPEAAGSVRVLELDHAGHYWPTPIQNDSIEFVEVYGFRNQDLDASDAVWAYFISETAAERVRSFDMLQ